MIQYGGTVMSITNMKKLTNLEDYSNLALRFWKMARLAEDRLRHSNYLELRNVSCVYHEGVLTLRGRVPSYHIKQIAQSLLYEVDGILELNNQLEVVAPEKINQ
jgi:hypothetical protein